MKLPHPSSKEPIFHEIGDNFTWGYACPISSGESPVGAFVRVLDHIVGSLPGFARIEGFSASNSAGDTVRIRDLSEQPDTWLHTILGALPDDSYLQASLWLIPDLQMADGTPAGPIPGNTLRIEYASLDDEPRDVDPDAILVFLSVYFDFYHPIGADSSPDLIQQAEHNRPRLNRFLACLRDNLKAEFFYRNYPSVGPLGVLDQGASQDGLPSY